MQYLISDAIASPPEYQVYMHIVLVSSMTYQHLVSDAIASPPEHQADYSEKLLLFPDSYFPTDLRQSGGDIAPPRTAAARRTARAAAGLPPTGALVSVCVCVRMYVCVHTDGHMYIYVHRYMCKNIYIYIDRDIHIGLQPALENRPRPVPHLAGDPQRHHPGAGAALAAAISGRGKAPPRCRGG